MTDCLTHRYDAAVDLIVRGAYITQVGGLLMMVSVARESPRYRHEAEKYLMSLLAMGGQPDALIAQINRTLAEIRALPAVNAGAVAPPANLEERHG